MDTTVGSTRAATSANDGIVTDVTGPCAVGTDVAVCACDCCMNPRSAVMSTPNATDAITIAMVDNILFVAWLIASFCSSWVACLWLIERDRREAVRVRGLTAAYSLP